MPTNPTKPRPLAPKARKEVESADLDLAAADNSLSPMYNDDWSQKERHVARSRFSIAEARRKLAALLGWGTDDSENGNGSHE